MADRVIVDVVGEKEILDMFKGLKDAIAEDLIIEAAMKGGEVIAEDANRRAPGPHIKVEVLDSSADHVHLGIAPDKEHWYYIFLETGATAHEISGGAGALAFEGDAGLVITKSVDHPGMAARPFLRPAIETKKEDAFSAARDVFDSEIEKKAR